MTFVSFNSSGGNVSWVLDYPYNNKTATNGTYSGYYYCKYDSDVSSSYAVTAFVFLAIAQVIVMGLTKCFCFDGEHKPGSRKSCAIVSFVLLWYFIISTIPSPPSAQLGCNPSSPLDSNSGQEFNNSTQAMLCDSRDMLLSGSQQECHQIAKPGPRNRKR